MMKVNEDWCCQASKYRRKKERKKERKKKERKERKKKERKKERKKKERKKEHLECLHNFVEQQKSLLTEILT